MHILINNHFAIIFAGAESLPDNMGNTAQWELRALADLLSQLCSMKNGKYIQYSRIFHTFTCVKISRQISLPHYAVLP